MTSRERLRAALEHREGDRVPVDLGATSVTGMHVVAMDRVRRAVIGDQKHRVKVRDPYQMLGEVDDELRKALGVDVAGALPRMTRFGFENSGWKPMELMDGTEVLVPGRFDVTVDENGDWLMHVEGDRSLPVSGRMPRGGYYFDAVIRQEPIDEQKLDPADNCEEFGEISERDLAWMEGEVDRLYRGTEWGVVLTIPGTSFGDIAQVPGVWMRRPRGIRDVEEWYISTVTRKDYIRKVFERQCEVGLGNIRKLIKRLGDRVDVATVTGTDFGTQRGLFVSVGTYRELYKPFHKAVNELIHRESGWKTFIHSCGSVYRLIPEFIEAGFDILNPVQCSAAEMEPRRLKREFGKEMVFWGGGVDTQRTLAFGTAEEVYREVRERVAIFGAGGGFVFDAIHNVQAGTPVENVMAMFKAVRESAG